MRVVEKPFINFAPIMTWPSDPSISLRGA
eukprot:COSAG02_NODE_59985_length_272_cov_1.179191_1_plen_28_part_10